MHSRPRMRQKYTLGQCDSRFGQNAHILCMYCLRYWPKFCLALDSLTTSESSPNELGFGFFAKRSYTFVYYSRYCEKICLALTTQKTPETFTELDIGHSRSSGVLRTCLKIVVPSIRLSYRDLVAVSRDSGKASGDWIPRINRGMTRIGHSRSSGARRACQKSWYRL